MLKREVLYTHQLDQTLDKDVLPDILTPDIVSRAYPRGDFHRLYYGQIMGTYAE